MSKVKALNDAHPNYDITVDVMQAVKQGEISVKAVVQAFDKETGKLIRKSQGLASGPDLDETQKAAVDIAINRVLGVK